MLTNLKLRLLSYLVIFYMLVAFAWWSVLLYSKNKDAYYAKVELLKMGMVAEGIFHSNEHFLHTKNYLELTKKYQRQEWMIFGEASVFIISLVIGIWLINRGYNKEIEIAHQRRNFLLSITHELKSPIASIRLVLETFLKRKLKPEQFERFGKNAIKDSERLNELVNNLLFAAKLETAYQPHLQPIHLDELTTDLVDSLSEKFPNVIFTKNIQNEISSFEGDQNGMVSIITNLIENAVKYNFTEHPKIEVNLVDQNEKITLEISDNGIGISDKEKKKIFERFYRVGNEDTRTTKGTGLGLYIVSQIVKAHQGKITVANNHPKGTIFKIVFSK
jgi:two-component system phosphate regulon sensor histidine kinase PhoR